MCNERVMFNAGIALGYFSLRYIAFPYLKEHDFNWLADLENFWLRDITGCKFSFFAIPFTIVNQLRPTKE